MNAIVALYIRMYVYIYITPIDSIDIYTYIYTIHMYIYTHRRTHVQKIFAPINLKRKMSPLSPLPREHPHIFEKTSPSHQIPQSHPPFNTRPVPGASYQDVRVDCADNGNIHSPPLHHIDLMSL